MIEAAQNEKNKKHNGTKDSGFTFVAAHKMMMREAANHTDVWFQVMEKGYGFGYLWNKSKLHLSKLMWAIFAAVEIVFAWSPKYLHWTLWKVENPVIRSVVSSPAKERERIVDGCFVPCRCCWFQLLCHAQCVSTRPSLVCTHYQFLISTLSL